MPITYQEFMAACDQLRKNEVNIKDGDWVCIIHPNIVTGYWRIRHTNPTIARIFCWLGHKLHNKYIYWIGRPFEWLTGLYDLPGCEHLKADYSKFPRNIGLEMEKAVDGLYE